MSYLIENSLPAVQYNGLNTNKSVDFSGASSVNLPSTLQAGGVIVARYEPITVSQTGQAASSWAASNSIFVADNISGTYQVAAVSVSFGTASSSGTLQVEVATGTQAVGAGVNQLTGTVSLSGTANTTVNGTVIASPTTVTAGSRINLIFGGTVTGLANCTVNVVLQRLS